MTDLPSSLILQASEDATLSYEEYQSQVLISRLNALIKERLEKEAHLRASLHSAQQEATDWLSKNHTSNADLSTADKILE